MSAIVVPVLLVLVVLVLVAVGLRWAGRRQDREVAEVTSEANLHYRVPEGRDPTPVITALQDEGYGAALHGRDVVVQVAEDRDRDRVRTVISRAAANLDGDPAPPEQVRFRDETGAA